MIQVTPQMRVLVATEPADFRRGIDGLARLCREALASEPFDGTAYVFRNRRRTAIKVLLYDGQGFWCCHKRLSAGRFRNWPSPGTDGVESTTLEAHELWVLLFGGDPTATRAAPMWRRVGAQGLSLGA
jgi:transposase